MYFSCLNEGFIFKADLHIIFLGNFKGKFGKSVGSSVKLPSGQLNVFTKNSEM